MVQERKKKVATNDEHADRSFVKRLEKLVRENGLRGLSRKIDVPNQSINRYLKGAQPPASFCRKLVENAGVNPAWLLTGQGSPMLSDLPEQTGTTAQELLELVQAMEAVSRMRLGALTGKQHLKVLYELNEALEQYESLRERINQRSEPMFEQIITTLRAVNVERDLDRALPLVRAGEQIARLCESSDLQRQYDHEAAHYYQMAGDHKQAMLLRHKAVIALMTSEERSSKQAIEEVHNYILALRWQLRFREALELGEAYLAMSKRLAQNQSYSYELYALVGYLNVECGELESGIKRLTESLAKVPESYRERNAKPLYGNAMMLAGAMTFEEVCEFIAEPHPSAIAAAALWDGRRDSLEYVAKLYENYPGYRNARANALQHYLQLSVGLYKRGKRKVLSYLQSSDDRDQEKVSPEYLSATGLIIKVDLAQRVGSNKLAWQLAGKAWSLHGPRVTSGRAPLFFVLILSRAVLRLSQSKGMTAAHKQLRESVEQHLRGLSSQGYATAHALLASHS